jgi:Fe-S-cluster containining protein
MCTAMSNPCMTCGACCAFFRVAFYWSEADASAGGQTPPDLTAKVSPYTTVMRGTEQTPPRCVALHGTIGADVRCVIHALRPSPCREFQASWVDGLHNERCDRARAAYGLPPLSPPGDSR